MWPLRRNVQYNKKYFFKDIFFFVLFFHLFLLGVLFVCDTSKFHQEKFVINTNNLQSTVVFMPLQKRVSQKKSSPLASVKNPVSRQVMSHNEYEKKVMQADNKKLAEPEQKQIEPVIDQIKKEVIAQEVKVPQMPIVKPVVVELVKKSPTIIKAESSKKIAPAVKKPVVKKPAIKKPVSKNAAVKAKIEPKKKVEPKVVPDKKNETNPATVKPAAEKEQVKNNQPKIESVIQSKQADLIVEKVIEKTSKNDDGSVDASVRGEIGLAKIDLENVSFVGSLDLEMMQIKEQIHSQIAEYYKPPVGISKKAVCELSIAVGSDGKAHRVTVKKSSGSIANDICARAALLKIMFPKEVIGKEIIVELGQS